MTQTPKKDIWDKLKSLSSIIASVFIPLVLGIIGNEYTSAMKESEHSLRYTELAIEILNDKPSESNKNIRLWAVELINQYSTVELNKEAKSELVNNKFIKEKYAPYQINSMVDFVTSDQEWIDAIENKDSIKLKAMLENILVVIVEEVLDYSELIKNPREINKDTNNLEQLNKIKQTLEKLNN